MARTSSPTKPKPKPKPTEDTEPKEWVVEAILKHKRKGPDLKYLISWEACDETTWETESDVGEGEAVDTYWAESKVPLERYTLNSPAYRALSKQLKRADEPKKPKKRASRSSSGDQDGDEQEQDELDEQEVQVATKKRARRSNDEPEHNGHGAPGQNDVKPAVKDEQVIDVDAYAASIDGRVECGDWMETYGDKESWENEIQYIDTLVQDDTIERSYCVRVVWHDNSFSLVPLAFARKRCVQMLLDFMVENLKFSHKQEEEPEEQVL
ncbi:hypothetical protein JCM9279_005946 [Rhodotorula babjevae]